MNLLPNLRSSWLRRYLVNRKVVYATRWAPDVYHTGSITRVKDKVVWIGSSCLNIDSIVHLDGAPL